MALDPRLAEPLLLVLAARRAKERQVTAPRRTVTLQVIYAAGLDPIAEPEIWGESYTYELQPRPLLAVAHSHRVVDVDYDGVVPTAQPVVVGAVAGADTCPGARPPGGGTRSWPLTARISWSPVISSRPSWGRLPRPSNSLTY